MKPLFAHDCNNCKFIGNVFAGGKSFPKRQEADLYICSYTNSEGHTNSNYILRTGDSDWYDDDIVVTQSITEYLK